MNNLEFATKPEAAKHLKSLGMSQNYSRSGRSYWWYNDRTDAMLDHSATITRIGSKFYVAIFDRKAA